MKTEHTCMSCGTRSTEVEHVEYGLYQCIDIDVCMNNYYQKEEVN